jgi:hypothetical protein
MSPPWQSGRRRSGSDDIGIFVAAFSLTGGARGRMMSERPARVPARRTVANAEFSAPAARPNESLQQTGAPARLRRQATPGTGAPAAELRRSASRE